MNIALWIAQILLAGMFLMGGLFKATQVGKVKSQMSWAKNASNGYVRFIGLSEVLGAIGLIVPYATGIAPMLTPIAAVGIGIIMLLAIGVHARQKENQAIVMNIVLLALAIFVAIGRM